ncbi:NAD-dependent epimerase/dehydratase family protein [Roseovarius salis]|uniref:NAD-dependent epimerase/dehydratase family protein n=1 Tax=Roseovarius salis TaxID=3376063 RepID=UPI0037CAD237
MTQFPQDRTVLVTGSGGRLGRLLRRAAARDGTDGLHVIFQSGRPGADLSWAPGDPESALPASGTIVALWGCTAGSPAELAANETLVAQSRAVARACGARRLLHLSSAGVYGPGRAMTERTDPRPASDYARSKMAMERAVARLPADDGLVHCCLRLANVVGADSLGPALLSAGPVVLDRFEDGRGPLRSYAAPGDLLAVLCGLARLAPGRLPAVVNVASPVPTSMAALARAAGRNITWRHAPGTAVQEVTLDTGLLASLLPDAEFRTTAEQQIADWKSLETQP